MSHINFVQDTENYKERKTKVFAVFSNTDGTRLGTIEWKPQWRTYWYVGTIEEEVGLTPDCMDEISFFIRQLMKEWREGLKHD